MKPQIVEIYQAECECGWIGSECVDLVAVEIEADEHWWAAHPEEAEAESVRAIGMSE